MSEFQKKRLEHAICYFAREFQRRAKRPLPSMGLWKLLAFMDFWGVKEFGRPVFGLAYLAWKMGPVPIDIYNNHPQSPLFQFKDKGENRFDIIPTGVPDMDHFSGIEKEKMGHLIEIYGDPSMKTGLMSEASHQSIQAWRRAYSEKPNQPIDYKLEFSGDIDTKPENMLTPEEEEFFFWRGAQRLNEAG